MRASSRKRKVLEPWSPSAGDGQDIAINKVRKRAPSANGVAAVEPLPKTMKKPGKGANAAVLILNDEIESSKVKSRNDEREEIFKNKRRTEV